MVVTLQREVVDRLKASTGEPAYGVLTLLVQLRYEVADWFKIPAACFFPAPEVDSACLSLRRRAQPLLLGEETEAVYVRLVKTAFSQRRKMMLKLLKTVWPTGQMDAAFGALGLPASIRAEAVSLEQFVQLARRLRD